MMNMHAADAWNRKDFEKTVIRHMVSTFLLWYISKHRTHGYGMIKQFGKDNPGHAISASQLYPLLKSLLKRGLISQEKEMQGKRVKKVYTITPDGRSALLQAKKCMCDSPLKRRFLREMVR